MGAFGRFVFGKRSTLSTAASSVIDIIFIYCVTVVVKIFYPQFEMFLSPLPYVTIFEEEMLLFTFTGVEYTQICSQILNMVILAFLINIVDRWTPPGKNMVTWLFFRCVTVVGGLFLHLVATNLLTTYLPEGIITYAPTILLVILALMLLTGALKVVVGALLTTVNPLIAAFYTFFFANFVGKQITKAVLTTSILTGLVYALEYFGISSVSLSQSALIAYIPFLVILIPVWYLIFRYL